MSAMKEYVRKLSRDEAREGFIFLTKDAMKLFPAVGDPFSLRLGDKMARAQVRAVPCTCVGSPHEHYHLVFDERPPSLDLAKGQVVVIRLEGEGKYTLGTRD